MNNKILFIAILSAITFSCNFSNKPKSKQKKEFGRINKKPDAGNMGKTASNDVLLNIDQETINKYKSIDESEPEYVKTFKNQIQKTINSLKNKPIDSTILTVGYINSDTLPDTIVNRIYLIKPAILIKSEWIKDEKTVWEEEISNPYMWVNEKLTPTNDSSNTDLWVTLTIALNYSLPELVKKDEFNNINSDFSFPDLSPKEKTKAIEYLANSSCDLLIHGQPEERNGLYLWYEPQNQFILYYAP